MLILTRKQGERIEIGNDCVITIVSIQGDKVRVGIDAPKGIKILREEIGEKLRSGIPPLTLE